MILLVEFKSLRVTHTIEVKKRPTAPDFLRFCFESKVKKACREIETIRCQMKRRLAIVEGD
jgi:hypothetical protein